MDAVSSLTTKILLTGFLFLFTLSIQASGQTAEVTRQGNTWTARLGNNVVYTGNNMTHAVNAACNNMGAGTVNIRNSGVADVFWGMQARGGQTLDFHGNTVQSVENVIPIYGDRRSNITIRNLHMTGAPRYGIWFRGGSNIHLHNIRLELSHGPVGLGIRVDHHTDHRVPTYNLQVTGQVYITGTAGHGFETYGIDGIEIESIVTRHTGGCGVLLNDSRNVHIGFIDAFRANYGGGYAGFRVANNCGPNIVVDQLIARECGRGFFSLSGSHGTTVNYAEISDCSGLGIWIEGTADTRVLSGYVWNNDHWISGHSPGSSITVVNGPPPHTITAHPQSQAVDIGDNASFSLSTLNPTGLNIQWFHSPDRTIEPSDVMVGTGQTLALNDVQPRDEGYYYCKIVNSTYGVTRYSAFAGLGIKRCWAHWTLDEEDYDSDSNAHLDLIEGRWATSLGPAQFTEGIDRGAVSMDVLNNFSMVDDVEDLNRTGQLTVSFWLNWYGPNNGWQTFIGQLSDGGGWAYDNVLWQISTDHNSDTLWFQSYDTIVALPDGVTHNGQWQHIVVAFDGTAAKIYIDGLLEAQGAFQFSGAINAPLCIGAYYDGSTYHYANGAIDDIRIFNYALSAEEINTIQFGDPVPKPWKGEPYTIPGRIQAEHFDFGGPNVAYYDTTPGNSGGAFRLGGDVDIVAITDARDSYAITDIETGEWLLYTINSAAAETDIIARVASIQDGGQIQFWLDSELLATLEVPNTGSLTTWQTVTVSSLPLPERQNAALRIEFVGSGFRLNWFQFGTQTPYLGAPFELPGQINFEDFDIGGQQISYYDNSDVNGYGGYRPDEPVDILQIGSDYLVYAEGGEWLEYTCNIKPGYYTLVIRNSVPISPMQIALSIDGQALAQFALPSSGGFFNWQETVVPNIFLPGGPNQQLRVSLMTATALLDSMVFYREYNVADLTQSGRVDIEDFAVLAAQWLGAPGTPSADIAPLPDGDGVVDVLDLLMLADNWLLEF